MTVELLIHIALAAALVILLAFILVITGRMLSSRLFKPLLLLYLTLPIGQIVLIYSFGFSSWTAYWVAGVLLCLVADLILLAYTIAQEKKTELQHELRETRQRRELERSHYEEVEQRRVELADLSHSFNTRLTEVAALVRSGENGTARELISSLASEINMTRENPYCAVPVVNALLTEKSKECISHGIALQVELDIPPRLSVGQMHLCSIFGNLMDNAIAACKQQGSDSPTIRLFSKVDGDYLFIKAANPSSAPPFSPLPGRGYGIRILSELALHYGGSYQSEYNDGVFTALVSLLAVGGGVPI